MSMQPYGRPPYLEKADPGITPAGWYTVGDGRELWWDGHEWVVTAAMVPHQPQMITRSATPTNHVLHLVLTLVTCGLWAPVWAVMAIVNSFSETRSVSHYQ